MTKNDKEFRIALVGCGRISKNHFDAIAKVDGLRLVAVSDVVEERARDIGKSLDVPWYASYEEMLKKADADVVTIATPSGLHSAQGVAAAVLRRHLVKTGLEVRIKRFLGGL